MHSGGLRFFAVLHMFEQENQRHAAECEQTEQPERVHKRPQVRLPV